MRHLENFKKKAEIPIHHVKREPTKEETYGDIEKCMLNLSEISEQQKHLIVVE